MKKLLFIFLLFTYNQLLNSIEKKSAITYIFNGGRFGDNLVNYAHAKWLSFKFNIPLLYKPFQYSNFLFMHKNELLYDSQKHKYKNVVRLNTDQRIQSINPNAGILYELPYFPISFDQYLHTNYKVLTEWNPNWNNNNFIKELKKNIRPIIPLKKPNLPKNYISVAVHVRRGDLLNSPLPKETKLTNKCFPNRLLPYDFYIQQIKKIFKMYNGSKLFVYIFTDHILPNEILKYFRNKITNKSIKVLISKNGSSVNALDVLSDFFSLLKFDCIIKPYSNFSAMATKLAKYKIEIEPCHVIKVNNKIKYQVTVKDNRNLKNKLMYKLLDLSYVLRN